MLCTIAIATGAAHGYSRDATKQAAEKQAD